MLHIHRLNRPEDKWTYFKNSLSQPSQWIVSNIEAKTQLQNYILKEKEALSGRQILRASEYWQLLFKMNCPRWRVVSESLIFTLIEDWFERENVDQKYRDIEAFYNLCEQFLPLLNSQQSHLMKDWLEIDLERQKRLSGWLQQVKNFWSFLNDNKWISQPWSLAVLLSQDNIFFSEPQTFYFDLGADLKHQEAEILVQLSKTSEVHVFRPSPLWENKYPNTLSVYRKLEEVAEDKKQENFIEIKRKIATSSFASVILEVQAVIKQVRYWIESGVPTHKIAVVSSNIEDYWDLLREYFLVEGISVDKNYVGRSISLPYVQFWLSRLHLNKDKFEQHSLEESLFNPLSSVAEDVDYSEFKKNFFNIYDVNPIKKTFSIEEVQNKNSMKTLEFIEIIYQNWKKEDKSLVDQVADHIIADLGPEFSFTYDLWLKYLELILSRMESLVHKGSIDGVVLSSPINIEWGELDYIIAIGCSQKNLRETVSTPANIYDILSAERDLGFYLNRPERDKREFDLRWVADKVLKEVYLYRSESDFEGAPQVAASLWLQLNQAFKSEDKALEMTRWQQLMRAQMNFIFDELGVARKESEVLIRQVGFEHSVEDFDYLSEPYTGSLSASSLSKLAQCSFKFYSEKLLQLKEPHTYDLDIDALYQGSLIHKVLEELLIHHPALDISNTDLETIYDRCLKSLTVQSQLSDFWLHEKPRHISLLKSFLDCEKLWQSEHPNARTLKLEASIRGYIGLTPDKMVYFGVSAKAAPSWKFRGQIDRVDIDSNNNLAVIDYKMGQSSHLKSFKSWPKNEQFQLVLYALALQENLGESVRASDVVVAGYLFLKEKKRGAGFVVKDMEHELADTTNGRSRQLVSVEEKQAVFNEILEQVAEELDKLSRGCFVPVPKRPEICDHCHWRGLCRAPHLK